MSLATATTVYIVTACIFSVLFCIPAFRVSRALAKYRSQNVNDDTILNQILLAYVIGIFFVIRTICRIIPQIDTKDLTLTTTLLTAGLASLPGLLSWLCYFRFVHLNRVRNGIESQ